MVDAKPTPGLWKYDDFYVVAGEEDDVVCEVWVKNHEANARLIAAAPEMLEALKALVEEFRFAHVPKVYAATHPVNVAQAVIAKAEGRE